MIWAILFFFFPPPQAPLSASLLFKIVGVFAPWSRILSEVVLPFFPPPGHDPTIFLRTDIATANTSFFLKGQFFFPIFLPPVVLSARSVQGISFFPAVGTTDSDFFSHSDLPFFLPFCEEMMRNVCFGFCTYDSTSTPLGGMSPFPFRHEMSFSGPCAMSFVSLSLKALRCTSSTNERS